MSDEPRRHHRQGGRDLPDQHINGDHDHRSDNISTATTTTVRTTPAGNRFHVLGLYLRAGGAQTVVFQSDANVLSGVITLADNEEINMPMGTVPHMSGQATGESFKITTTAAETAGP
jgi:hypothetical protein